jgi:hypothetical protein
VLTYRGYREALGRTRTPEVEMQYETWTPDPEPLLEALLTGRVLIGTMSTVMIRREAFTHIAPFDETLRLGSDWQMCLELVVKRMKIDYLSDALVERRWHGANLSRDTGLGWEHLCLVYDRFFDKHASILPQHIRKRSRTLRAYWHLQTAIDAIRHGDKPRARRHISTAARIRPLSIRPGWVRMLGIGRAPSGPWP